MLWSEVTHVCFFTFEKYTHQWKIYILIHTAQYWFVIHYCTLLFTLSILSCKHSAVILVLWSSVHGLFTLH